MYYKVKVKDFIRLPPDQFGKEIDDALVEEVKKKYDGYISKELGLVIDVEKVNEIAEGIIIPGDGACFYETTFDLITFIPELQEVLFGTIKDHGLHVWLHSCGNVMDFIPEDPAEDDQLMRAVDLLKGLDLFRGMHTETVTAVKE